MEIVKPNIQVQSIQVWSIWTFRQKYDSIILTRAEPKCLVSEYKCLNFLFEFLEIQPKLCI